MNYQVLARKWRPSNFTDVVGQEHVIQSLMNALQHDRLHHAYLFTGTRGVGKTTIARLLAKAMNCENLQNDNPCGQCTACRELSEGRFMDLIEVDAASRTKVEDTRDLLDNAQYAPNYARYKIYLIDEVHMLSGHSFNALLKTLEEPPPHVKFLLATTDPQKIPVTVLSRCLQYNLKRLLPAQIFGQMQEILQQEKISAEPQALHLLARAADGSMRDGLSLLDQAIVFGSGSVSVTDVSTMLGSVAQQPVEDILTALADSDANAILQTIAELANTQPDFSSALQQLLQIFHRIALTQQIPSAVEHEFDKDMIIDMSTRFMPEDIQLFYQIALLGQRDLELAPDSRMGFEMIMLRLLAFKPTASVTEIVKSPKSVLSTQRVDTDPVVNKLIKAEIVEANDQRVENKPQNKEQAGYPERSWVDIITHMKLESLTKELANNCALVQFDSESCQLLLDASCQQLLTSAREKKLLQALQDYSDKPIKLVIEVASHPIETPAVLAAQATAEMQQAAVDSINADPNVQALKEHFDARIMPGTIAPV